MASEKWEELLQQQVVGKGPWSWQGQPHLWALTWQTCCGTQSPEPGGQAHTGRNTA